MTFAKLVQLDTKLTASTSVVLCCRKSSSLKKAMRHEWYEEKKPIERSSLVFKVVDIILSTAVSSLHNKHAAPLRRLREKSKQPFISFETCIQ